MANIGIASSWQRYCDAKGLFPRIVGIFPFSILPVKQYYRIKAFVWLKHTFSGNQEVPLAINALLDRGVNLINALSFVRLMCRRSVLSTYKMADR